MGGQSSTPHPELRPATTRDVPRLKNMLADAFFEDPVLGWLIPAETNRRARLRRFFAIELRHIALARGRVWTTGELTGAALCLPPGAWRVPLHATLLEGTAFGVHVPRAARLGAAMERHHVRQPHHYVRDVGVHPSMQGKGLGSALLRPLLERCDGERLPAYLEASSERNAALYERLGFQIIDELSVGDSPPLRLMLRPPNPRRTPAPIRTSTGISAGTPLTSH
ncbi:MAG TPA: GNAT family N-acetyltransferase [Solirubrobacteraceae bacterium]|jgi:GNAT superfamily N-acetyltransferase|nr:GNAT family N-acetyltransferase [Solirubrobacteraceae bacterium]